MFINAVILVELLESIENLTYKEILWKNNVY